MDDKSIPYFNKRTEASIDYEEKSIIISLHKAKVRLHDQIEIELLKHINPALKKEIEIDDDQLKIHISPPGYFEQFIEIHKKSKFAKWQLSFNLLNTVENHSLKRLKVIVCPNNILIDSGLMPHFLHYGVKESIPPYEDQDDITWHEVKAAIASIVDDKYDFETYFSHYETIDLSDMAKQIMYGKSYDQLRTFITKQLKKEEKLEQSVERVPRKKWKTYKYSILALSILFIPAVIYVIFTLFFKIPEMQSYVETNKYFLQKQYSSVMDEMENYKPEKMPYVVKYQLAMSIIENETLTDEQRKNIQNTITLQTDDRYFLYWIYIGRSEFEEAIDIAKRFEDRDLILYGLYKNRLAVQRDPDLKGKDREEKIKDIDSEIEEYESEIEEEQEELEREQEEELEKQKELNKEKSAEEAKKNEDEADTSKKDKKGEKKDKEK